MKVSLNWLRELVDYNLSSDQLTERLSLSSIGVKQQIQDYLELDLTYNRGDLLSLRGMAYEISAITDTPLKFLTPPPEDFIWVGKKLDKTPVKITSPELSEVQCVARIENLKFGPSPKGWIKKLEDSGMRSVNNIADVTNLIMLEYGQPLHAFDAETVKNETIVVRRAKKDEKIKTLDNKQRILIPDDIVLADTQDPLDVAGVMGGKDTEVKENTTAILLSASIFHPIMVRKTSQRLGLYSQASKRFQHGLSKMRLFQALDAAIRMYQDLGGKLTAINLVGDFNQPKKIVNLSLKKLNNLLGTNLDEETITSCLKKLNFTVNQTPHMSGGEAILEVIPPYFRLDINIEEDLIEEVARMYGYEKIEGQLLSGKLPAKLDQTLQNFIHALKVKLKDAGLTEVQTYSFYSTKVIENLKLKIENFVRVANPISSETEYLRTFIWPNLVEVVGLNLRQGYQDIAIFEIGKIYLPGPKESYRLSIALMNGTDNPIEELIGIFYRGSNLIHLRGCLLKPGGMMKELETLFHPKRYANIEAKGKVIGGLAEVHPRLLNSFGIEKRLAIMEISLPQQ
ncbi:MAG: phenylalanine--tRNA ligase subunit beta [Patescibacteria group bacterium]